MTGSVAINRKIKSLKRVIKIFHSLSKPRNLELSERQQHLTHWRGRSMIKLWDTFVLKASPSAHTTWDTRSWIQRYTQSSMAALSNGVHQQKNRQLRSSKINWVKQKCANELSELAQSTDSIRLFNFDRLSIRCRSSSRLIKQQVWGSWGHTRLCNKVLV